MDLVGEGSESSAGDDPAVAIEFELAALAVRRGIPRTEEEARWDGGRLEAAVGGAPRLSGDGHRRRDLWMIPYL